MATQFATTLMAPTPVPFLLGKTGPTRIGASFAKAVQAAVAAERAQIGSRKCCQRIAHFLCELGKAYGCRADLPLSRAAIASALGISPVRVKRSIALLSLSGVLTCEGDSLTILDWRKLGGVARFDLRDLDLPADEDEYLISATVTDGEDNCSLTANGDPACFV